MEQYFDQSRWITAYPVAAREWWIKSRKTLRIRLMAIHAEGFVKNFAAIRSARRIDFKRCQESPPSGFIRRRKRSGVKGAFPFSFHGTHRLNEGVLNKLVHRQIQRLERHGGSAIIRE